MAKFSLERTCRESPYELGYEDLRDQQLLVVTTFVRGSVVTTFARGSVALLEVVYLPHSSSNDNFLTS